MGAREGARRCRCRRGKVSGPGSCKARQGTARCDIAARRCLGARGAHARSVPIGVTRPAGSRDRLLLSLERAAGPQPVQVSEVPHRAPSSLNISCINSQGPGLPAAPPRCCGRTGAVRVGHARWQLRVKVRVGIIAEWGSKLRVNPSQCPCRERGRALRGVAAVSADGRDSSATWHCWHWPVERLQAPSTRSRLAVAR